MRIGDIIKLIKKNDMWPQGVIGQNYLIADIKQTEFKLCDTNSKAYCFFTSKEFVVPDCGCKKNKLKNPPNTDNISMSVPEGLAFNTAYTYDHTIIPSTELAPTIEVEEPTFESELDAITDKITALLKEKNKAYGNTALNPTNIFSKLNASEAICARIARIKNKGINDKTEDTIDDLIGYLFLLKMSI